MRKKFDKKLYNKCDNQGKNFALELFEDLPSYSIEESIKKTDVDFKILKKGIHVAYLEVEIKRVWKGDIFEYDTVNFPERKWKYCKLDKPTLFLMVNGDLTNYLCVTSETLINSPLEMVRNKYVKFGELFFKVPVDEVVFDNIKKSLKRLFA